MPELDFRKMVTELSDDELDTLMGIVKIEKTFRGRVAELKKLVDGITSTTDEDQYTIRDISAAINALNQRGRNK